MLEKELLKFAKESQEESGLDLVSQVTITLGGNLTIVCRYDNDTYDAFMHLGNRIIVPLFEVSFQELVKWLAQYQRQDY